MPPKRNNDRINAILDSFTDEQFAGQSWQQLSETEMKVEYLPIRLVYPDPSQPRRVLPASIYQAFHAERYTPVQALKEFVRLVQVTARQKGRPFSSLDDLLPNPEDESDTDLGKLTPEEELLRDLVTLDMTIRDDGQVNPLTVVDKTQGVTRHYRIETGERRYWATWVMIDFLPGYQGDATLPCIIVPNERASVFRQAKENTSRAGLNAMALARQAALLILAVHDIHPSEGPISGDFYRQALDLDLRGKREFTSDILAAMGGISRGSFSRIKALISLSDEAIELADRHNIDEGRLRHVVELSPEFHEEMVRQIIDYNLTRRQVQEICEQTLDGGTSIASEAVDKEAQQFVKMIRAISSNNLSLHEVARLLIDQENDVNIARARIQKSIEILDALDSHLEDEFVAPGQQI